MKTIKKIRIDSFPKRTDKDVTGEELITKIRRILDENEPLTDGAPLIYTPKEKGVIPEYNIRTDKWQIAMGAMDRVSEYKLSEYMKKPTRRKKRDPTIQVNQIKRPQQKTTSKVHNSEAIPSNTTCEKKRAGI